MTTTNRDATHEVAPMACDASLTVEEAQELAHRSMLKKGIDPTRTGLRIEPKLDGFRILARTHMDGAVMWTRGMKYTHDRLPEVQAALGNLPSGWILDGEIVYMGPSAPYMSDVRIGQHFEGVQEVMLSLPERAIQLQEERGSLWYVVFDLLQTTDVEAHRFCENSLAVRSYQLLGNPEFRDIVLNERLPVTHISMLPGYSPLATQEAHQQICDLGYEGSVIKHESAPYMLDGRGHGWYKIKKTHTIDVIVMGYQEGEGKFLGTVGSIIFGQPDQDGQLVERGRCSGMDDETRDYVNENREALLGTVIEVSHMGAMRGGIRFRHPQFKRFRDDKPAEQVIWE